MSQQINLYQPIFRRQKALLSATALVQICILLVIGLSLIYSIAWWRVNHSEKLVGQLETEQEQYLANIAKLDQAIPLRKQNKLLADQAERLKAEKIAKHEIIATLHEQTNEDGYQFSELMGGLGRQRVQGLWLKRITISRGGHHIDLNGSALNPTLIPQLLQQLKREETFAGRVFHHLSVNRAEQESKHIDFSLQTIQVTDAE